MNKKVIMSLGLSAAALSLSTIDASAAQTAIVTTSVLNVRTGAGTNYSIMSKVYKGDTLEVIGSLNGWYNIKLSNGKTGWVSGDYLSISGSSTNTESKKGTVTTDTLNVRSGAGTSYSIISKVYKGDTVNIVGSSNGWYKIELSSGKTGWVSG
ncbi:MAG: SH3 domain-containing protein, partial [Peptostreptococcaceae bacterium]|nr:SH3 domain-containing protein [Peptostreptococcaceae bacterium]